MSALDNVVATRRLDSESREEANEANAACSELAQLRADRTQLLDDAATLQGQLRTVQSDLQAAQARNAEQARQLEQAREVISAYRALPTGPKGYTSMPLFDLHNAADEWLNADAAANRITLI